MKYKNILLFCCLLAAVPCAMAGPASDAEFAQFKSGGAGNFSAEHGRQNWTREMVSKEGERRSCTTCHGSDLTKPGKHATTNKVIEPMAASINGERYTDQKKTEKWFKRNCEWTWARECTAQEKGDILMYLMSVN
jgi:Domain of unknown function (DUF1924)